LNLLPNWDEMFVFKVNVHFLFQIKYEILNTKF
jgi:hypothetical protein